MRLPHHLFLAAVLLLGAAGCADDAEPAADATSEPASPEPTSSSPTQPSFEPSSGPATETTEPTTEPATEPAPSTPATPDEPTTTATAEPEPTAPPVDLSAAPTTYDEAMAHFDATGQEPQELRTIETAGGTYCRLAGRTIGCELPPGGIPDPAYCGDGPAPNVGRIVLTAGGPRAECNSDTFREGAATPVDLGTVTIWSASGIGCLVEQIGVTCLAPERGHGFFLGPEEYHLFTRD